MTLAFAALRGENTARSSDALVAIWLYEESLVSLSSQLYEAKWGPPEFWAAPSTSPQTFKGDTLSGLADRIQHAGAWDIPVALQVWY
jgi:hypothetical protein